MGPAVLKDTIMAVKVNAITVTMRDEPCATGGVPRELIHALSTHEVLVKEDVREDVEEDMVGVYSSNSKDVKSIVGGVPSTDETFVNTIVHANDFVFC